MTKTRDIQIGQLTLHAPRAEAAARRLRAERLLGSAELRPTGMPAGSVLIVRAVQLRASLDATPLAQPLPAAQRAIERSYQTAMRPAHGPVPASAQSVLFADEAELLACLTRDVLAGQANSRWYWRHAAGTLPAERGAAVAHVWQIYAAVLPAALALLEPHHAISATRHLRAEHITTVTAALVAAYQLPRALRAPTLATTQAPAGVAAPPWLAWLPESSTASLPAAATALLGLALSMWHAPALARSTAFAAQSQAWQAASAQATAESMQAQHQRDQPTRSVVTPQPEHIAAHTAMPLPKATVAQPSAPSHPPALVNELEQWPVAKHSFTRLGGALYLINLLDALGWPSYQPEQATSALAGWRLLEALARLLLAAPDDHADPLWAALAQLDQRPIEQPFSQLLDQAAVEWVQGLADQTRALLARRLRDMGPAGLLGDLLRVSGRLMVGRTHVELHARLDSIDLSARAAGLDRDPGWVPSLGRVVLFHYE